jgi:ATP/maltotriose-dependent transcriptional regulator MalT
MGDAASEVFALENLGAADGFEGRLDDAERHLADCLRVARAHGLRSVEAHALLDMGEVARERGDPEAARRHHETALATRREIGMTNGQAETLVALARLGVAEGGRPGASATPLASAWLGLLREGGGSGPEVPADLPPEVRAELHLLLHRSGAGDDHLARARQLLACLSAHLEGEDLEAFWRCNPLARSVAEQQVGAEPAR